MIIGNIYKPTIRQDIYYRELDKEIVLYDMDNRKVHAMNAVASSIWKLCDGHHNMNDIVNEISNKFKSERKDVIIHDVGTLIAQFKELNLLINQRKNREIYYLKNYLNFVGEERVFYRVTNLTKNLHITSRLDSHAEGTASEIEIELKNMVFGGERSEDVYVYATPPQPYPIQTNQIVDITVLGLDEEATKMRFEKELNYSMKLRDDMLAFFNKSIVPFIKTLEKRDDILCAILRGDLLDRNRFVNPESDIDITLLTRFEHDDVAQKNDLVATLKKTPAPITLDYWYFWSNGSKFRCKNEQIKNAKGGFRVEYDLVSYPSWKKMVTLQEFVKNDLSDYHLYIVNNYRDAKIIFDKKCIAQWFLDLIATYGDDIERKCWDNIMLDNFVKEKKILT